MRMSICGEDLEREIILMEQELIFKRSLLDECRKKLNLEISKHAETKSTVSKYMNENKQLQIQLSIFREGTQKLEEENAKNRNNLSKLQVQFNAYLSERQQVLDNCFKMEKENNSLKIEVAELRYQIKEHLMFVESLKKKSKTEALVAEVIKKQELLNKEQLYLKRICEEGLRFAEKLSEEAKYQMKYVQEAQVGQTKAESEIIRLMAAVEELKADREREKSKRENAQPDPPYYLEVWESLQKEMRMRNEELQEMNQKLLEELTYAKEKAEMLIENYKI